MQDSSHDSARLMQIHDGARNRDQKQAVHRPLRPWIERAGACARGTAVWTSRAGWLAAVERWAAGPVEFEAARSEAGAAVAARTVVAVATAMAEAADWDDGQHCAITRERIAATVGCGLRTVTSAWAVLRASGWVLEARRGHGGPTTPACGRRPSIYHLISRRSPAVDNQPICHLPPSGGVKSSSPVGLYSPRARAARAGKVRSTRGRGRGRCAPRPLALQRLAAGIVARSHGLGSGHIGAVCDAIDAVGIDPAVWTARTVTDRLNADMSATGWGWPDRIERPGAFLSSRLRRLDWRPAGPPPDNGGGNAAASIEQEAAAPPASAAVRAAALVQIRATLNRHRKSVRVHSTSRLASPALHHTTPHPH